MKTYLLFFILSLLAITSNAQIIEGLYSNKWASPSGEGIEYSLIISNDGTFIFKSTRTYLDDVPNKTEEARGAWDLDGHLLILRTTDNGNELASRLNLNKAKYVNLTSRSTKFNMVKPSLKFFESSVFYSKNMELFKLETNVTTLEEEY